jgi:putative addiction module component (TIGR02574 family)
MKLRELPQVMALSTAAKPELIDDLWISIEPDLRQVDVSEEEKNLPEGRWQNFLANPDSALTLDQVKALLAARRK